MMRYEMIFARVSCKSPAQVLNVPGNLSSKTAGPDLALRSIDYTVGKDMQTVIENKSTQNAINVDFGFSQANLAYNERTWQILKPEVEKYIAGTGIGNIKDAITVQV